MKFGDLDDQMRVYETSHDHCVLPGLFMVARIDGRGFTGLANRMELERPFDTRFRDMMVGAACHLMNCGFCVVYGYTQSDEISLLLHRDDQTFRRKLRKLNSILAGEASASASLLFGVPCAFDCRVSQLPSSQKVVDYFRWRQEDAHRNALTSHCYWALRKSGLSEGAAASKLDRATISDKNEILFGLGINFNDCPAWQKRGVGVYWETVEKTGENPLTVEIAGIERNRLVVAEELPIGMGYSDYIGRLVDGASSSEVVRRGHG